MIPCLFSHCSCYTDEKAYIEKQQKEANKAVEGGTPSNTPPPLTPARDPHPPQKPSPLVIKEEQKKPVVAAAAAAKPTVHIQPSVKRSVEGAASPMPTAADDAKEKQLAVIDKNGKAVAGAESNGVVDAATGDDAAEAKPEKGTRKTISKTCHLL